MKQLKLYNIINFEQKPNSRSKFLTIIDKYPCCLKVELNLNTNILTISLMNDPSKFVVMGISSFNRAIYNLNFEVIE